MRINVYHHWAPDPYDRTLHEILDRVKGLALQGAEIMAKADEMLADLQQANQATNDIAADVDALVARLGEGGLSPEEATAVGNQLAALRGQLVQVAAKYPVPPPSA